MGTLRYVLPSTETRMASSVPFAEPLPSDEKLPRDNPTAEVAVVDTEPELVEAEVLVLTAAVEAAAVLAFRRREDDLGCRGRRRLERVERRRRRAAPGCRAPQRELTTRCEHEDGIGALAADQNVEEPVGLIHHLDRTGQRGSPPFGRSSDATVKRSPWETRISTMPSARAATTCPFGRACAASTCWPEKTTLAPPMGSFRSNRTRSPPVVTAKPTPLSPTKVGGWTSALPRLTSTFVCRSSKKPRPTPGSRVTVPLPPLTTARSGTRSPVSSRTITAMGPSPPDFRRGPGMPTQSPLASSEPKITETSLLPWSATSMSGMPSPLMSATVMLAGAVPTK